MSLLLIWLLWLAAKAVKAVMAGELWRVMVCCCLAEAGCCLAVWHIIMEYIILLLSLLYRLRVCIVSYKAVSYLDKQGHLTLWVCSSPGSGWKRSC